MKTKEMRVLHLGNIANNAYLNAKFLREIGIVADVVSHDYCDLASTPEWADASSTGEFSRPKWFIEGKKEDVGQKFGYKDDYSYLLINKKFVNATMNRLVTKLNGLYVRGLKNLNPYFEYFTLSDYRYFQILIVKFRKYFPQREDQLSIEDILPYSRDIRLFKKIFSAYNLVQCYGIEPIYALLANKKPYIAFEHGTLRDFPFEKSPQGRLTALAYKMASLVFITNPDNIRAAKKLGLKNFQAIPHPINDRWHQKNNPPKTASKLKTIFCPARHDWQEKKINVFFEALAKTSHLPKFRLVLINWGKDVTKSKILIKKLKLENNVVWLNALASKELACQIANADLIFDQIKYHGFGGITAEALMTGKPVFNSYDSNLCHWIFPDPPPIISVFNQKDIVTNLNAFKRNPDEFAAIGEKGKDWFQKYHSKEVVRNILLDQYTKILK